MSVGLQVYQNVVRDVRMYSGVLEGSQVSEGCQVCQKVFRCVKRLSGVSSVSEY